MKSRDWLQPAIAVGNGQLIGLRGELPAAEQVAAALQEAARALRGLGVGGTETEPAK